MSWRPTNSRALAVTGAFALVSIALLGVLSPSRVPSNAVAGRSGCIALSVAIPPDDMPVMSSVLAAYDKTVRTVDGKCVDAKASPKAAGEAADALARGWDEKTDGAAPQVWLPGASSWVVLVRARATAQSAAVLPDSTPSFAQSPFVVAMPLPMATALGWPAKELGFKDLVAIGLDKNGWDAAGHPE